MSVQVAANPAPGFAKRPDHKIELSPAKGRVSASFDGATIADSGRVLVMHEGCCGPAHYFLREDVRMDLLAGTDHHTTCPYKGEASYWSLAGADNVAWSYQTPYDEMTAIKDYIAFYEDKVTVAAEG